MVTDQARDVASYTHAEVVSLQRLAAHAAFLACAEQVMDERYDHKSIEWQTRIKLIRQRIRDDLLVGARESLNGDFVRKMIDRFTASSTVFEEPPL